MNEPRRFRILSLDGGGIRGMFTAAFLAAIERRVTHPIYAHFDLITGTSTGGLIALGLALGMSAQDLVRFYSLDSPRIFRSHWFARWWRWARGWIVAKHDAAVLAETLRRLFGETTLLAAARCPVVIPAFDVNAGLPVCFKTNHHHTLVVDQTRPVWEIGMATAAAPTYFPPFRSSWGTEYIDGGVWANRPSLVGVIEAIRYFAASHDEVEVLAIGTTRTGFRLGRLMFAGIAPWLSKRRLVDVLMEANSCAAGFQTQLLLGGALTKLDVSIATPIPLDDARCLEELRGLGEQAAKQQGEMVCERFFKTVIQRSCDESQEPAVRRDGDPQVDAHRGRQAP